MPNKLGKAFKKASQQIQKAAEVAAKQTVTNLKHLNEHVQIAVLKNVDLRPERLKAREAIEKNTFLVHQISEHGSFNMVIQGLEYSISESKKCFEQVGLPAGNEHVSLNTDLKDRSEAEAAGIAAAKANVTSAESILSEVRISKKNIQIAMDVAIAQFKILQDIPDAAIDQQAKIDQGKAAAKLAIESAQHASKLFAEVDIWSKNETAHQFLGIVYPELYKVQMLKDRAAMQDASGLDVKAAAESRDTAANFQASPQPAIIHQYAITNASGGSADSAAITARIASDAPGK